MKEKFYYGWVNVIVLWLVYLLAAVPFTYTFGIISSDMASALGLTMAMASAGYTCYSLFGALMSPGIGRLINHIGAKKTLVTGVLILLTASLLMAFCVNGVILYFIIWAILFPAGVRCSTLIAMQDNMAKWFFNKRGLVIALIMTAGGIGGYLFTPLMQKISDMYGWRGVWIFNATCNLAALLMLLLLRSHPESVGQKIDNGAAPQMKIQKSSVFKTAAPWTVRMALRQPAFYILVFIFFAGAYLMVAVGNYAIGHLMVNGLDASTAATAVGYFAIINTVGRLVVGAVSDKIDLKFVLLPGTLIALAGCGIMLVAKTAVYAFVALVVIGLGYGVLLVAPQTLLVNYFGVKNYAEINGTYTMISGIISALPAVVIGAFYDSFGNYNAAWYIGMVLMLMCGICIVALRPPKY